MPFVSPDPEVLKRIPLSARTILDVGCGDGRLAEAYRLMNPMALILGIERDPIVAALAERHMDRITVTDIETEPMPFDMPGGIDCIIYSGILEHLHDPHALLHRHAKALSPDGIMLIVVPNLEHWRLAEGLLRGGWSDDGSIPHSLPHPQSFHQDTLRRTIREAGLFLCDVIPHDADADANRQAAQQFADVIGPALLALDVDPADYLRRASPTHFIWRVRRKSALRVTVSGTMLTPIGGVSHVRVIHPLQAIGSDPLFQVAVANQVEITRRNGENARIFVLHRPALTTAQGPELLRALMDGGYLVVTEFDDHPDFFRMMQLGGEISFRGVHAIQTSTPALAEVLRKYNPEVAIFPNAIASLPTLRNFTDPHAITLFFGALNREGCWGPLIPAINAVAARAGKRLRFQVVHDRHFFEALDSPHKAFTPTCDYDTYQRLLGESEISFMPLSDTTFNRAKSDLKFIEAGACRVATLASTVVYGDSVQDGRTGLLFRDAAELYTSLLRLVTMPQLACRLGDSARDYVMAERMLAYQVAPRIAWYRSLWRRKDRLAAALRARMGHQANGLV